MRNYKKNYQGKKVFHLINDDINVFWGIKIKNIFSTFILMILLILFGLESLGIYVLITGLLVIPYVTQKVSKASLVQNVTLFIPREYKRFNSTLTEEGLKE